MSDAKPYTASELPDVIARLRATVEAAAKGQSLFERFEKLTAQIRGGETEETVKEDSAKDAGETNKVGEGLDPVAARERIRAYLSAANGKGAAVGDLAQATGLDKRAIQRALSALRDRKEAKLVGKRRKARWHAL